MGAVKKHQMDEAERDRIREAHCYICGGEWQEHIQGIFCPTELGGQGLDYFKPDPDDLPD